MASNKEGKMIKESDRSTQSGAVALVLILFLGQKLLSRWFHLVAARRSQELFVLNLLLVTLGAAFITDDHRLLSTPTFPTSVNVLQLPLR